MVGAWACYLAASAFVDYFDVDTLRTLDAATAAEVADMPVPEQMAVLAQLCEGAISPVFFHQVVGVMPVLLLALGIEFNYFRRTLIDAGERAATAATVTVMAAGLVGALSTLPWDGKGCGDVLSGWHGVHGVSVRSAGHFHRVGDSNMAVGRQHARRRHRYRRLVRVRVARLARTTGL